MRVQLPMEEGGFTVRARVERSRWPPGPRNVLGVIGCPHLHRGTDVEKCRACAHYCGLWVDGDRQQAFVLCELEDPAGAG